jgi:hypothetical protein
MYACIKVMCCLLPFSIGIGRSESVTPPAVEVLVYLKSEGTTSPAVVASMMRELGELMQTTGFHIEWGDWKNPGVSSENADLAVVVLRGACSASSLEPSEQAKNTLVLASTAVANAQVLPFSWIDCTSLGQFLGPSIAHESAGRRDFIYGRAMARLLGHELYHILAHTVEHTPAGVAKERFRTEDLLAEHFSYENEALFRLHFAQSGDPVSEPAAPPPHGSAALDKN